MNIGIDHGYYAIKTRHFSFPAGISEYSHEPYTLQNTLEYGGKFFVCGTGRQPILRNKMENENYYLLTLAAIAKEIQQRGAKTDCSVTIAAGLPLAGFGREKKSFREYLRPSSQPVSFQFEGVPYKVTVEDVKLLLLQRFNGDSRIVPVQNVLPGGPLFRHVLRADLAHAHAVPIAAHGKGKAVVREREGEVLGAQAEGGAKFPAIHRHAAHIQRENGAGARPL